MNVADQNALQERSHNTHKVGFVEKQCDSAMKKYSAPSNFKDEQLRQNSCHLTHVCCLPVFTDVNCRENIMARAKLGQVQIRHILLDAEGLSARENTESIQYEFMMQVISSMKTGGGKNKIASHCFS